MAGPSPILAKHALGSPAPWPTMDPFLFAVHHNDKYPAGDESMAVPAAKLRGRALGSDFSGRDGYSMYHGRSVPGFPAHPHWGLETVTVVRKGRIDHSDSLGATARFGGGDCQWMTAGRGISHCEMFPLRERDGENPLELFQLWLNLPAASKRVEPHFAMFWAESIPLVTVPDADGRLTRVTLYAGALGDTRALPPPPSTWAGRPESDVAIWTIAMPPGGTFTLPPARAGTNRMLYYFSGGTRVSVNGEFIKRGTGVQLEPTVAVELVNEAPEAEIEMLLLQGAPIGEPVVHHGPFVATSQAEMRAVIAEYQRTQFGGWPWDSDAPVHAREVDRFAIHADKRRDEPPRASA